MNVYAQELEILRFAAGSGIFSLLILVLAALNLARVEVFITACGIPILLALRVSQKNIKLPDFAYSWKLLFGTVLLGFGCFYFINALAPEISPDGSSYHLGIVAKYLRQHGLGHITNSIYANLSQGLEMLFLSAFSMGRHSAATLIEFAFFAGIPVVILAYSRRFGFPKVGVTASIIIFCSPVFAISGSSAYNDAAAVFVLFCLFYTLQIWDTTRQPGLLVVAGLLAGFCYGIKYTLFLSGPYCFCFVAWKLIRARQPVVRPLITVCCCAGLLMAPWWIKNSITVRNPISPFGNRIFSNPYVTPRFEREYLKLQSSAVAAKDRYIESTIRGGSSGGYLGPIFMMAPLGLLALRYRQGRQAVLASAIFLIPALANIQTRFLMLAAPFVALSISFAVMRARWGLLVFAIAVPVLALPNVANGYCDSWGWHLREFPLRDALRLIPERDSLKNRLEEFQMTELINNKVPANGLVFSSGVPKEAYLERETMVGYESALGENLTDMLIVAMNPAQAPSWIHTFRFPEKHLQHLRIVQTGKGSEDDDWSVGEIKLIREGTEIRRTSAWQLNANPNPWDAGFVLDGNPATRWRSLTIPFTGMDLELDLGRAELIDSVEVDCSNDQSWIRMRLETKDSQGQWRPLDSNPEIAIRPFTGNLRRYAIEEFTQRGITHILLNKGDEVAPDFQRNSEEWGVRLVGKAGNEWLYEIK